MKHNRLDNTQIWSLTKIILSQTLLTSQLKYELVRMTFLWWTSLHIKKILIVLSPQLKHYLISHSSINHVVLVSSQLTHYLIFRSSINYVEHLKTLYNSSLLFLNTTHKRFSDLKLKRKTKVIHFTWICSFFCIKKKKKIQQLREHKMTQFHNPPPLFSVHNLVHASNQSIKHIHLLKSSLACICERAPLSWHS